MFLLTFSAIFGKASYSSSNDSFSFVLKLGQILFMSINSFDSALCNLSITDWATAADWWLSSWFSCLTICSAASILACGTPACSLANDRRRFCTLGSVLVWIAPCISALTRVAWSANAVDFGPEADDDGEDDDVGDDDEGGRLSWL